MNMKNHVFFVSLRNTGVAAVEFFDMKNVHTQSINAVGGEHDMHVSCEMACALTGV